jgi:hypothetical protein
MTEAKPGLADLNRTLFIAYPRGAAVLSFATCTKDASGKICDWESAIRIGEKRQEANKVSPRKGDNRKPGRHPFQVGLDCVACFDVYASYISGPR